MLEPVADRPSVPDYGIPESRDGLLPWSWADERLAGALQYWLATTRPDGRPHAIPIWGAWVDGHWYVEGGPRTVWQRSLRAHPYAVVHWEHGDEVVIVEGPARELVAPAAPLARRILAGYAKYRGARGYVADPANWRDGGLWEIVPSVALGWSRFPDDMTRWRFPILPGSADAGSTATGVR